MSQQGVRGRQLHWESDGLTYRLATPADSGAVWQLMAAEFYPRTALCQCLEMKLPDDVLILRSVITGIVDQGVSLVAEDAATGQLIGARPSSIELQEGCKDQRQPLLTDTDLAARFAKCSTVYRMFDQLTSAIDVFQRYDVTKVMAFKFLVVRASHGGRGIAKKLVQFSLEVAKEFELELVTTCTGSRFSERIYESLGFDRLSVLCIPEFVDPLTGGKPFAKLNTEDLKNAVLYAKRV